MATKPLTVFFLSLRREIDDTYSWIFIIITTVWLRVHAAATYHAQHEDINGSRS